MTTEGGIHPTAIVAQTAKVASDVSIGPYAIIENNVEIGARSRIAGHAIIRSGTVLAENVHVDSTAILGGLPQDLSFDPATSSGVVIGADTVIREGVTIHRSTRKGGVTRIGEAVILMANSHVAHDCEVGDRAIVANGVLLAGYVTIGQHAFLGGAAVFHQFVRVGESAMVSGASRIGSDVPPYVIAAERNLMCGLNLIGLRRRGFPAEVVKEIKMLFRFLYSSDISARRRAEEAAEKGLAQTEQGQAFLKFYIASSKRGVIQPVEKAGRNVKGRQ